MASVIDTKSGLPVLEVGPGTGVITKAILARGVKPRKSLCGRIFARFRRAICRRNLSRRQRHRGRCLRSRRHARRQARHWSSTASSRACRCSTFRSRAASPISRACSTASRTAGRSCSSPTARSRRSARPRRLYGRAFPFHPPQHPADAALDLPARRRLREFDGSWRLHAADQEEASRLCARRCMVPHIDLATASPIAAGKGWPCL